MAAIGIMTDENTRAMEDATKETQHLEALAESLQGCVSRFRT